MFCINANFGEMLSNIFQSSINFERSQNMFSEMTSLIYHTAEDLRLHCVSSYWPRYYSTWVYLTEWGNQRMFIAPFSSFMVIKYLVIRKFKIAYLICLSQSIQST